MNSGTTLPNGYLQVKKEDTVGITTYLSKSSSATTLGIHTRSNYQEARDLSVRYNTKQWEWGWTQWGFEIQFITKEAIAELEQAKKDNPGVDFEQLAVEVRGGRLKPNV